MNRVRREEKEPMTAPLTLTCQEYAVFRYTWPGRGESFICLQHSLAMIAIAKAMGLYVQLVPLAESSTTLCTQILGERQRTS